MLFTSGLSPVAQLFSGTSGPSPVELAPVAPEWPITPIESNAAVRWTAPDAGLDEAALSVPDDDPQPVTASATIRHSASLAVGIRGRNLGRCTAHPLPRGGPAR